MLKNRKRQGSGKGVYSKKKRIGEKHKQASPLLADILNNMSDYVAASTERKRLKKALWQSEEEYKALDKLPIGICEVDIKGKVTFVNKRFEEVSGYSREEVVGKSGFKLGMFKDETLKYLAKRMMDLLLGKPPHCMETQFRCGDGRWIWVEIEARVAKKRGIPVGFQITSREVTERKQAEEELAGISAFLSNILSNMSDYVLVTDEDYTIRFLNDTARKIHGDIVGKKCYKAIRERDSPCYHAGIPCEVHEIIEKGGDHFEDTRLSNVIGRTTNVRARPTITSDGRKGVVQVSRDVTEEKKSKERLENSLSLLRATLESTADGIIAVDIDKRITTYNQKYVDMWRVPDTILESRDDSRVVALVQEQVKDPESFLRTTEELFNHPDLERSDILEFNDGRTFERYSRPQRIQDKTVGRVISIRDITERKRMEAELKRYAEHLEEMIEEKTKESARSRQFLETSMESAPDFVYIKDKDFKYVFVNEIFCKFHGKSKDQILGGTVYDVYPREQADFFTQQDRHVLKTGSVHHSPDLTITDVNGSTHIVYAIKTPLKDAEGNVTHLIGITRDITELKRMEGQLRQAERLAAIGETTAIVGHDLRNPLQSIVSTIYLAKRKYEKLPLPSRKLAEKFAAVKMFNMIEEQVRYMNKIVTDLHDYSRPLQPQPAEISIPQLINDTFSMMTIPITVKVSVEVEEGLKKLMVDPDLMKRLFTNLTINALQAMSEGGQLTIKASKKGEDAFISFQDSGAGIPEENLDKLFSPFFTTKAKGQGLGLPVCKRLVEAHGGTISVESKVGQGSTFTVKLPLQEKKTEVS